MLHGGVGNGGWPGSFKCRIEQLCCRQWALIGQAQTLLHRQAARGADPRLMQYTRTVHYTTPCMVKLKDAVHAAVPCTSHVPYSRG